jgi:predicted ATP-dependent endonuclease of OLD family
MTKQDKVISDYRLVELRCSNFKALKAIAVRIDGAVLKISGQNGAGKSSVLDIISAAIGGAALCPKQAIRKGQTEGMVSADFGELKATRRFSLRPDGTEKSDLTVEFSNGKKPRSPQDVLNELRGSPIADDPLEFSRLKPTARYDLLKRLVPDFDFEEQAKIRKVLFDDRTAVGRDCDKAKGAAASIIVLPNAPERMVDITELAAELRAASEANALIDKRTAGRDSVKEKIEDLRDKAEAMTREVNKMLAEANDLERKLMGADPLPPKIDVSAIEQQIMDAETTNNAARRRAEKIAKEAEAKKLSEDYDDLTKQIKTIDDAKAAAIENAKLPVPELSFGEGDILLDGLPFDQASTARKIRVSTALLMALKPELRVLLVREGSLLDDEARAALEADAIANDFIVLLECVGAGDGAGIVIQDGEVVS